MIRILDTQRPWEKTETAKSVGYFAVSVQLDISRRMGQRIQRIFKGQLEVTELATPTYYQEQCSEQHLAP